MTLAMKFRGWRLFSRLAPRYGPHYGVAAQGFLRGLGLVYVLSFWSFAAQAIALSGPDGLQPVGMLMSYHERLAGASAPWWFPGLFWMSAQPVMLLGVTGVGALAGLCLMYGALPWLSAAVGWACWVSLLQVCQPWLSTPGDVLLAEAGFLGLFFIHPFRKGYPGTGEMGSRLTGILLCNGLLCKVMFSSGLAKLTGGDPDWENATAFFHFFETQPLPSAAAWYAHHLPETVLKYGVWALMFAELVLPFYVVLPRTFRNIFAGGVVLEALILLATGHHGFLPLLMILLAFTLVDDVSWRRVLPESWGPPASTGLYRPGLPALILLVALLPMYALQSVGADRRELPPPWRPLEEGLGRVHSANRYFLFARVPETRRELSIQGSVDGRSWVEYRFKLKPTDPRGLPSYSMLHLPRLDDQFAQWAARVDPDHPPPFPIWMYALVERLLVNHPATLSLFPVNPFPESPPRHIRLVLYEYRFADPVTRREEQTWWVREPLGMYGPVFSRGE